MKFCPNCGKDLKEGASFCPNCGSQIGGNANNNTNYNTNMNANMNMNGTQSAPKSKMAAGLLGLFLGAWGIHNFYLGYTSKAITQIIVTLVTCGLGGLWGFIEGIMILAGNINTDSEGRPLSD